MYFNGKLHIQRKKKVDRRGPRQIVARIVAVTGGQLKRIPQQLFRPGPGTAAEIRTAVITATSPAAAATAVASPVADTAGIADTRILTFLLNPVLHVFLFLFWSLISKYCSPLLISHHLKIFLILLKKFTKKCRGFSQN
jgi:hypothetical protein